MSPKQLSQWVNDQYERHLKGPEVEPEQGLVFPYYTPDEEQLHTLTHGLGAALSLAGLAFLVALALEIGSWLHLVGFGVYGSSMVALYLASTLYHATTRPRWKKYFQTLDHAMIYVLIAGTYTPFILTRVNHTLGLTLLAIVWLIALVGFVFKIFFVGKYRIFSTVGYILMGWLCIIVWQDILTNLPAMSILWLSVGAAIYGAGTIFFALERLPFNHAIWHLFVLAGSVCHFMAVIPLA